VATGDRDRRRFTSNEIDDRDDPICRTLAAGSDDGTSGGVARGVTLAAVGWVGDGGVGGNGSVAESSRETIVRRAARLDAIAKPMPPKTNQGSDNSGAKNQL